jgi:threonine/homoserine/homoserine lactone efflux protein
VNFPIAFAIGFSIASIPGPTIILIATETIKGGARAGLAAMMAPVLIDAAVMVPLGWFLQEFVSSDLAKTLGIAGGCFLAWLGFQSIRAVKTSSNPGTAAVTVAPGKPSGSSFAKAAITHFTSPYPYLYWSTVGGSYIRQALARDGFWEAAVFPLGFWLGAVTFTTAMIYLLARGRRLLSPRAQPAMHILSGTLLIAAALTLVYQVWHDWA